MLRFDDSGKPTTVFESSELAAQAIAFDAKDNLYVGTSPDGKVYKVTPDGQKSVFFDPKTKYIWALAVDSQGALFVATGDKGEVFVVTPDGKGQLFYQSEERHARSLAFDSKGNLLIGTEPNGLILRVEIARKSPKAAPEAGASFVIYETNKAEVTSLVADAGRKSLRGLHRGKVAHAGNSAHSAERRRPSRRSATLPPRGRVDLCTAPQPSPHSRISSSRFPASQRRRRGSREDRARRLAANALDLARRPRVRHGTFARGKASSRHGRQREP